MTLSDIKISILFFLIISFPFVSRASEDDIRSFKCGKGITADQSSMLVIDLTNDSVLLSINADLPLIPASIMKSSTTAALLSILPPDYRFPTRVYTTGKIYNDTLQGNLLVKGSGDPSLNSRYVADSGDICSQIVNTLKQKKIKAIEGNLIIDESIWSGPSYPESWASGDLPHAYGTASHGLNFEDNASGGRSVKNPAAVFESRLRTALRMENIHFLNDSITQETRPSLILEHFSVPLDEIMRSCMMRSDNQYAEALFRTFPVTKGKSGSILNAENEVTKFWKSKHAPLQGVSLIDGSGLSRKNRITANFMAHVLKTKAPDPYYPSLFPLAGQEGTLRRFLAGTPLEGYIALKTGSMNGIQCYAGYKLDEDYNPTHIIVVMLNELKDRASARTVIENILLNLFPNLPSSQLSKL